MMNNDTFQFIVRCFALVVCGVILLILGTDIGAIFHFGDGEAIKLIDQLNGPLIAGFGSLSGGLLGHQVLSAVQSFIARPIVAQPGAAVVPSTTTVPVVASQTPLPAPDTPAAPAPAAVPIETSSGT